MQIYLYLLLLFVIVIIIVIVIKKVFDCVDCVDWIMITIRITSNTSGK